MNVAHTSTEIHIGVGCDACAQAIAGTRYHCTGCPNTDFCASCYDKAVFAHHEQVGNHLFLRIDHAATSALLRSDVANISDWIHPNITCLGCKNPVTGFRYSCTTCPNVHLCKGCEASGANHDVTHTMIKVLGTNANVDTKDGVKKAEESAQERSARERSARIEAVRVESEEIVRNAEYFRDLSTAEYSAAMVHISSGRDGFDGIRTLEEGFDAIGKVKLPQPGLPPAVWPRNVPKPGLPPAVYPFNGDLRPNLPDKLSASTPMPAMAHWTSGRDGLQPLNVFGPKPAPETPIYRFDGKFYGRYDEVVGPAESEEVRFGMGHVSSGRDGFNFAFGQK